MRFQPTGLICRLGSVDHLSVDRACGGHDQRNLGQAAFIRSPDGRTVTVRNDAAEWERRGIDAWYFLRINLNEDDFMAARMREIIEKLNLKYDDEVRQSKE